jgi:2-(3-amino-3-carboxypropyl)histidine synthase
MIAGIPEHITNNELLIEAVKILPSHYNFEIYKTLYRIETLAKESNKSSLRISLQFP